MRSFGAFSLVAAAVLAVAACSGTNGSGPADGSSQAGDGEPEGRADAGTSTTADGAGGQTTDVNANETGATESGELGSDADATTTNDSGYDGGPVACGGMTCASHEVCVFNQFEGGAYRPPDDAGYCPDGEVRTGVACSPAPSYRCIAFPAACSAAGISCGCAQALCQDGYDCMSVAGGVIGCYRLAP